MVNTKIDIQAMQVNFTPYAMAKMSDGLFKVCESYKEGLPALYFFLYSASIELGLKSAILSRDNSIVKKNYIKNNLGHDIEKGYKEFQVTFLGENLLNQIDLNSLKKINPFYRSKGLEYFTVDTMVAHTKGLSSFPSVDELKDVASKVNRFLEKNTFFNNC